MKRQILIILFIGVMSIGFVMADDLSVFQGQYFVGDIFQVGTYEFDFNVYDSKTNGNLIFSYSENITTGNWGQWKVELEGISDFANNVSKNYFMEIIVEGVSQLPRNRITQFQFLRKNVDEITTGNIRAESFGPSELRRNIEFFDDSGFPRFNFQLVDKIYGLEGSSSFFIADSRYNENETSFKSIGMSSIESSVNQFSNFFVNLKGKSGGFSIIDSVNKDPGKNIRAISGLNPTTPFEGLTIQNSRGRDIVVYGDEEGNKAFFVDSANNYETTINAVLNVTDKAYFSDVSIGGKNVCLSDGTNCLNLIH